MLSSVESYLAQLPDGMSSFPGAQVKGSVVRSTLLASNVAGFLKPGDIPERVASLIREPPAVHAWIPEVDFVVAMTAVHETVFLHQGGTPAFEDWMLGVNRSLLSGPLYKVLFLVVSPERVFVGADKRWGAFHRGSTLRAVDRGNQRFHLELTFPERLFPVYFLRALGTAFRAGAEAAGCKHASVGVTMKDNVTARYDIIWK